MTQAKAASLTSALFARKGAASPANLVIAELDEQGAGELSLPNSQAKGRGGESARRRKARLPELGPELPLLAMAEAKTEAKSAVSGVVAQTGVAGLPDLTVEADPPVDEHALADDAGACPAASLLERRPLAAPSGAEAVPQRADAVVVRASAAAEALAVVAAEINALETRAPEPGTDERKDEQPVEGGAQGLEIDEAEAAPEAAELPASSTPSGDCQPRKEAKAESPEERTDEAAGEDTPAPAPPAAPSTPRVLRGLADLQAGDAVKPPVPSSSVAKGAWRGFRRGVGWQAAAVILLGIAIGLAGYGLWPREAAPPPAVENGQDAVDAAPAAPQPVATTREKTPEAAGDAAGTAENRQKPVAPSTEPSFDIIRIEPNGQSIIAGRADPFSEWIILNNGKPIGSVQADANGEWVMLPDASLVPGANDFSLVPKAERGKVAIPGADDKSSERSGEQPAAGQGAMQRSNLRRPAGDDGRLESRNGGTPLPRLKPARLAPAAGQGAAIRLAADGRYAVQIASVRESAAAEQERARLVRAYSGLLGSIDLRVQEARIDGAGVFFRLRSGTLENLSQARELCRLLESRGQGCLVVGHADRPALPVLKPAGGPSSVRAPTQQAENPE